MPEQLSFEFGPSAANAATVTATLTCSCQPYVDVFTYQGWRKQGYQVRKGTHAAVKVPTFRKKKEKTPDGQEVITSIPKTSSLFCRCQVDTIGENGSTPPPQRPTQPLEPKAKFEHGQRVKYYLGVGEIWAVGNYDHDLKDRRYHVIEPETRSKKWVNGNGITAIPNANPKLAERLQGMAEKMTDGLERRSQPPSRQNTPRQRQQFRSRMHDVNCDVRVQQALFALADCYNNGTLPLELEGIKTKKAISPLVYTNWDSSGGYYDGYDTGKYGDDTPEGLAMQKLIEKYQDPEADKKRELALLQMKAKGLVGQVDGYFPTPRSVSRTMLSLAGIENGDRVLEPSAGDGAIADHITERYDDITLECVEWNYSLAEILSAKGHLLAGRDILEYTPEHRYDKIVMNPPFEKKMDIDHVMYCFENLLEEDGRLVSVMGAGIEFNSTKKSKQFREFVDENGYFQELPEKAFEESGTNVRTVLCILDK